MCQLLITEQFANIHRKYGSRSISYQDLEFQFTFLLLPLYFISHQLLILWGQKHLNVEFQYLARLIYSPNRSYNIYVVGDLENFIYLVFSFLF